MSKFDPEFYRRYRPYYPAELYSALGLELAARGFAKPYQIADVGCGTGHSTLSLLRSGLEARVVGVDPDPAMLEAARELCPRSEPESGVRFQAGSGETTGLDSASLDAVTVGSAFHWMNAERAREELSRILKPSGLLLVYEYQFPKALAHPDLNEWIRREFNLRWKAPGQRPRGDFETVTACFRGHPRFRHLGDRKVPMILELGPGDLTGLILSQSRVLHYEAEMSDSERAGFQRWLGERIAERLGSSGDRFDFNLQAALFEAIRPY
jgi:SAM-dependent methyltransferase